MTLVRRLPADEAVGHTLAFCLSSEESALTYVAFAIRSKITSDIKPRDVFRVAANAGADMLVLIHGHQSPQVTIRDHVVTQDMVDAGPTASISLLDSVVWSPGSGEYFSFRERLPHMFTFEPTPR